MLVQPPAYTVSGATKPSHLAQANSSVLPIPDGENPAVKGYGLDCLGSQAGGERRAKNLPSLRIMIASPYGALTEQ